ncbi:hypothetical protein NUW54_g12186 [Trametes sanguinea]|uniref:Uncharacterized protein n=1 Tax=Trametes sanguinea TaxID=158606 RepID=A0ACC1N2V9_9APHY|nr:hypothetical protein NUW54_g12186 [Trametes sanguinea]
MNNPIRSRHSTTRTSQQSGPSQPPPRSSGRVSATRTLLPSIRSGAASSTLSNSNSPILSTAAPPELSQASIPLAPSGFSQASISPASSGFSNASIPPTPSGFPQSPLPLSSQSPASGAHDHTADPAIPAEVQTTLQTPISQAQLLISLTVPLGFLTVTLALVGLILVCKRLRRRLGPLAPSAARPVWNPASKGREEHELFPEDARFRLGCDMSRNNSEITLTPRCPFAFDPHRPASSSFSVAELLPARTFTSIHSPIETRCDANEAEANAPAAMNAPSYSNLLSPGTIDGDQGLGIGGNDGHARSLRLRETVSSQLTISAQSLSPPSPVSTVGSPSSSFFCSSSPLSPSHPPFNRYMEKDVIPTAVGGLQNQAPDEQHSQAHPR